MLLMIVGAVLIGMTLGLMGSGGSIMTVPVLVYLLGHDKNLAVAESMAIVGTIAVVAAIPNTLSNKVHWRSVVFFGVPGMLGTFGGAWIGAHYFSGAGKLLLFSLVMVIAAWSMFRKRDPVSGKSSHNGDRSRDRVNELKKDKPVSPKDAETHGQTLKIITEGTVVGIVTGIVGVGGGFLIVPALVLLGNLEMRVAVGTSLVIIALKCIVGFAEYQYEFAKEGLSVDWQTIALFSLVGAAGSFIGRLISKKIDQATLRKTFASLLVVMAILILFREAPSVLSGT